MKFLVDKQQIGIENQSSIGVLLQVTKQVDCQFEVSTVGTCVKNSSRMRLQRQYPNVLSYFDLFSDLSSENSQMALKAR
jgi:hypothetical protein